MTDKFIAFPAAIHGGGVQPKEGGHAARAAVIAFPPDAEVRLWWALDAAERNYLKARRGEFSMPTAIAEMARPSRDAASLAIRESAATEIWPMIGFGHVSAGGATRVGELYYYHDSFERIGDAWKIKSIRLTHADQH